MRRAGHRWICGNGVLLALLAIATPTSAYAGYYKDGIYDASPGEANDVTVWYDDAEGALKLKDAGALYVYSFSPPPHGCTADANVLTCTDVLGVAMRLGDRDDKAVVTESLPFVQSQYSASGSVAMTGGAGDDILDAGPGHPFTGNQNTSIDLIRFPAAHLAGDGGMWDTTDSGDDVLIGGAGQDSFLGGPGDDIMIGKGGRDYFEGEAFQGDTMMWKPSVAGADTMDGGPGSDTFNGIEGPGAAASDTITCGEGDEGPLIGGYLGPNVKAEGDAVGAGAGDSVATDCDGIAFAVDCPSSADSACVGETQIVTNAPAFAPARTSAHSTSRRKVTLGRASFKVPPGRLVAVPVALKQKRVNKLLEGRGAVAVKQTATARAGKKRLKFGRKRFVLRRG